MSLTNYLSNIYEAYSPFLNRSSDTYESYEAVLSKPDLPAQKISVADFTRLESYALKALATPFLMTSLYVMGKVAYTRHFSYKGLLFAATTFTIGHDLANGAEKLASKYLDNKPIKAVEKNGYSQFLARMLRDATEIILKNESSQDRLQHVYEVIDDQSITALSDAISNDIFLSARDMFKT